jgi:hypothetical protein
MKSTDLSNSRFLIYILILLPLWANNADKLHEFIYFQFQGLANGNGRYCLLPADGGNIPYLVFWAG